jgi:hypothetical protein
VFVFNILRRFVWSLQPIDCAGRGMITPPGEKCGLTRLPADSEWLSDEKPLQ